MHSYSSTSVHIIFGTANHYPFLRKEIRPRVHEYIAGIMKNLGAVPMRIGGMEDHLHALSSLPLTLAPADFVGKLKSNSSRWIHEEFSDLSKFGWQRGYSLFTVSRSMRETVSRYIERQEEHHRTMTFREEVARFLRAHGLAYDENDLVS